jgi:proteasome lid subunit RPN8/RPN11
MRGSNLKDAERHALRFPDREVCGFIYEDRYLPLTNIAKDPRAFIADPAEVALALSHHGEPLAIFHSHPDGSLQPSEQDLQLASYYTNSMMVIGTIVSGKLKLQYVTNV